MSFQPTTDSGPFYFSSEEKDARRTDVRCNDTQVKKFTKSQLIEKIIEKSNGLTQPKGSLKDIQAIANRLHIPLQFQKTKIIEGWELKPKGMLQVLWERGWIDPDLFEMNKFTVNGKKDEKGELIEGTSLKKLIKKLT